MSCGGPRRGYAGAYRASITNQPTCGGNKKAGLAPKIGVPINVLNGNMYSQKPPNCCPTWGVKCAAPYLVIQRPVQSTRAPYA